MNRKQAMEIIKKYDAFNCGYCHQGGEEIEEAFNMAIQALEQEPKTGHWIRVTDKTGHLVWECDKCSWQQRFNTNYCPDCGSYNGGD